MLIYPAKSFFHGVDLGVIERVEVGIGVIRVSGWFSGDALPPIHLRSDASSEVVEPSVCYRVGRVDVVKIHLKANLFCGFEAEWMDFDRLTKCSYELSVGQSGLGIVVQVDDSRKQQKPHYANLLTTSAVLGRKDIYGSGPPTDVAEEIFTFAKEYCKGQILDFGCGNGDLIVKLRATGKDVRGLEINRELIRDRLHKNAQQFVDMYDGSLPLPYPDQMFDTVYASEVLEHIDGYQDILSELYRICRKRLLITVPDMTCIPFGFPGSMVPWHLLESTHVNFFNWNSLAHALSPLFVIERYVRLCHQYVGEVKNPGSIGVVCKRIE